MTLSPTAGWSLVHALGQPENWLAVAVTSGPSAPQVSVVNAGILTHPVTGGRVVGLVARGGTAKLVNLRRDPGMTLVFRSGWEWVAVTGASEIVGPDDPLPGVHGEQVRVLLREIYSAAGGTHSDLDEYDRVMAAERRAAVLLTPTRFTANPSGSEHREPA